MTPMARIVAPADIVIQKGPSVVRRYLERISAAASARHGRLLWRIASKSARARSLRGCGIAVRVHFRVPVGGAIASPTFGRLLIGSPPWRAPADEGGRQTASAPPAGPPKETTLQTDSP